jgi:hypothetical protein
MAAMCDDCDQDIAIAMSCTRSSISLDGREWARVRYGDGHLDAPGAANGKRCRDCGVAPGGVHHAGCCLETCPACGSQLFCCDCYKDDGNYYEDEEDDGGSA